MKKSVAFLLGGICVLRSLDTSGLAAPGDALPYSKGYLLTGDYVVAGVDLNETTNPPDGNGLSTGTIEISGVPANADIVAAYLYWETITLTASESQAAGVKFRNTTIDLADIIKVKKLSQALTGSTAPCWSSGVPLTMHMFRADVLSLFAMQVDKDDKPTGKRLVNGSHTVTLPMRIGNEIPESAGASVLVVYRSPAVTAPLRKIVVYDGIFIKPDLNTAMEQTIQGFYKSASVKSAKITHIVGSGQPNSNEKIQFNGSQIASNPFSTGSASQRAWANPTYPLTEQQMNLATNSNIYGETVTTKVLHQPTNGGTDCLAWGAVIFSTAVEDFDQDGLPDGIEDSTTALLDPDDRELPNLNAMGAKSRDLPNGPAHPDLFVELNATWAEAGTAYGALNSPEYVQDLTGHHHLPTPEDLKPVGDAYVAHGITPHFDVGNVAAYHALGVVAHADWIDNYASTEADQYLVGNGVGANASGLARGGEIIKERACDPNHPLCQFPDYPGTVGWKFGLVFHRDAPVDDQGNELTAEQLTDPQAPGYFDWSAGTHRQRFDLARRGLMHYLLLPHARGKARSPFPCLVNGLPAPYDINNGTACSTTNPDFHIPTSASGVAELPGGNAMVTLGFWDEFVGKPFVRAATMFHELGHNLELFHGGVPIIWGDKAQNTATYVEPNCKPNYHSSMSYLFQVHGLFDITDTIHLDYSWDEYSNIDETATLHDGDLAPAPAPPAPTYLPAWYAPAGSTLALALGVPAATRYCSGGPFDPLALPPPTARVYPSTLAYNIDWAGDDPLTLVANGQDVNFDGAMTGPVKLFNGFNDWAHIRLNQVGASRGAAGFSSGDILAFSDGDILNFADGDILSFVDGDILSFVDGDILAFSDGDILTFTDGDILNFADGDILSFVDGDINQEPLSFDTARGLGRTAPYTTKACVTGRDAGCADPPPLNPPLSRIKVRWNASTVGKAVYYVERKRGDASSTYLFEPVTPSLPGGGTTTGSFFMDGENPNDVQFTYRVRARFNDQNPLQFSAWSRIDTCVSPGVLCPTTTAVNAAPVAVNDSYTAFQNQTLNVSAEQGVLANDTDVDSPPSSLRAVAVLPCSANANFTLNSNGSFSYRSRSGFVGIETCSYYANNGFWSQDPTVPMSANSNVATITFTVIKK